MLIRGCRLCRAFEDMALTTNGVLLAEQAAALYDAGLRRLNVHLDTLDRDALRPDHAARRAADACLAGFMMARDWGSAPIKINAVAVKDLVEPDIVPLARFGREYGIEIRYIEFMPLDAQGLWQRDRVLTADEILACWIARDWTVGTGARCGPACACDRVPFRDGGGTVGFHRLGEQAVSV